LHVLTTIRAGDGIGDLPGTTENPDQIAGLGSRRDLDIAAYRHRAPVRWRFGLLRIQSHQPASGDSAPRRSAANGEARVYAKLRDGSLSLPPFGVFSADAAG